MKQWEVFFEAILHTGTLHNKHHVLILYGRINNWHTDILSPYSNAMQRQTASLCSEGLVGCPLKRPCYGNTRVSLWAKYQRLIQLIQTTTTGISIKRNIIACIWQLYLHNHYTWRNHVWWDRRNECHYKIYCFQRPILFGVCTARTSFWCCVRGHGTSS